MSNKPQKKSKKEPCQHSRTVKFFPENVNWYSFGVPKGKHYSVEVEGCLNCHQMWIKDCNE